MKKFKIFSLVLCAVMLFTACGSKAPLYKERAVKLSDKHVQCLINKDFDAVIADSDEKLQKQIDAPALGQAWESVVGTAGGFVSATAITYESNNGVATVATTAEFENQAIVISLSYNNDGKLIGIWFNYAPQDSIYQPIDTDSFTEKVVLVGEYEIKGVVTTPDDITDYPVVVLVQGSGASDFDETIGANKPFKELAHGLAEKGIASVRINKRFYQKPVLSHD